MHILFWSFQLKCTDVAKVQLTETYQKTKYRRIASGFLHTQIVFAHEVYLAATE